MDHNEAQAISEPHYRFRPPHTFVAVLPSEAPADETDERHEQEKKRVSEVLAMWAHKNSTQGGS